MPFSSASFFNTSSSSDTAAELSASRRNRPTNGAASGQQREQRILVSSAEVGRLFDIIADVNRTVKKQEQALNRLVEEQAKCNQETAELREEIAALKDGQDEEDPRGGHYGPLPKQAKEDVRTLHNKQDAANQYRGNEKIDTPHNCRVRHFLVETIIKDSNYDRATIKRAATRYYETKRQKHLDSLPERKAAAEKKIKEKTLTSRRRRLYVQRMKVASEEEKRMLGGITHNFMSDEEDGDERDVWVVRSPSWRSNQLNTMLARLQERASSQETASRHPKYKRVRGRPSARPPPSRAPTWALNAAINQEEQEEPEEAADESSEPEETEDLDLEPASIEPPLAAQCSTPDNNRSGPPTLTMNNDEDDEMPVRKKRKSGKRKKRL